MINSILLATSNALSQDTTLTNIMDNTLRTALNTKFGVIALITFICSVISAVCAVTSLYFSFRTMKAQESTDKSTKGGKNVPSTQNLLLDMVRHLYRNLVVTFAIRELLYQHNFNVYPSELHLKKMEVNLNNIDLHILLNNTEDYLALSRLYDLLRNYHFELEITNTHLKDKNMNAEAKDEDLKVIIFKCDYLSQQIIETLTKIWPNSKRDFVLEAKNIITKTQNVLMSEDDKKVTLAKTILNSDSYYTSTLFADDQKSFLEKLNNNVKVELGKDRMGNDKIHLFEL